MKMISRVSLATLLASLSITASYADALKAGRIVNDDQSN